jgi:hypothetical protein
MALALFLLHSSLIITNNTLHTINNDTRRHIVIKTAITVYFPGAQRCNTG